MSAPQRSFGRTISRRVPASGAAAANADQTRTPGRRRPPAAGPAALPAAQPPPGLPAAVPGSLLAAAVRPPEPTLSIDTVVRDGLAPSAGAGEPAGPHPVELAGLLHELTARLLGADGVPHALDRLAAFAAGVVPGTLRCSVALIGEGGPPVVAASGSAAQALDDLQYAAGDGPALEAARTRTLVTAPELQDDPRWPQLAEGARQHGVRGVVAIPLDVQRSSVGALSLFVGTPGGIDPAWLLTAMAVVNQAEVLLGELRRREGLREGATVDRAAGVIIAQRGCGVQEAYTVLQETAQRLGIDRRTVAERLIKAAARNADA
ncbi:ANTAR domain-containing protein [Actinoplanes sp. NPDC049599]|uniref:ANTAR domain-containing protein n=1 Tax=Actinoplanes sp. NPDC049599 TaxID=3363903 RepID=UPI0037A5EA38